MEGKMNRKQIMTQVKQAILDIEPKADIIIYGSRTRENASSESDWDILILVDGTIDDKRVDRIRHKLYEIEWESDEILSSIVRTKKQWNSPLYKAMPIHKNIEREGIVL